MVEFSTLIVRGKPWSAVCGTAFGIILALMVTDCAKNAPEPVAEVVVEEAATVEETPVEAETPVETSE